MFAKLHRINEVLFASNLFKPLDWAACFGILHYELKFTIVIYFKEAQFTQTSATIACWLKFPV